jgi:hypothetical protein
MEFLDGFDVKVKNLRNKIKLNNDDLFLDAVEGFYNNKKEHVKKNMKHIKKVSIYFPSNYEKELFSESFKVNTAVEENVSGNETRKIMQLVFLIKEGKIKFNDFSVEVGNEQISTKEFIDKLEAEGKNEYGKFF